MPPRPRQQTRSRLQRRFCFRALILLFKCPESFCILSQNQKQKKWANNRPSMYPHFNRIKETGTPLRLPDFRTDGVNVDIIAWVGVVGCRGGVCILIGRQVWLQWIQCLVSCSSAPCSPHSCCCWYEPLSFNYWSDADSEYNISIHRGGQIRLHAHYRSRADSYLVLHQHYCWCEGWWMDHLKLWHVRRILSTLSMYENWFNTEG